LIKVKYILHQPEIGVKSLIRLIEAEKFRPT